MKPHLLQPLLRRAAPTAGLRNVRSGLIVAHVVEGAFDSAARNRGLLGRDGLEAGHALAIAPTFLVHTFGMRFAIDLLFVARNGRVVKVRYSVPPRRIAGAFGAFAVVELPSGQIEASETRAGDFIEVVPIQNSGHDR